MSRKAVEFRGLHSLERIRRLQDLCSSSLLVDGILLIGGVDSYHSRICQAVLKYLFLGGSGQELLGEQVISQEQERLEDVVLLIRPQGASIFYSSESESAVTILPAIAKWRNVKEYAVHDGMDPEEQEARKVSAFKSMVAGVERIGVPFGVDGRGTNLTDVMAPEKWPLVQSYALDEDGSHGKGFFTMNHKVVNVTSQLVAAMAQLDTYTSQRVLMESEPLLAYHFEEFLRKLDHAESPDTRCKRSEAELAEDLLSFYAFGTTQHSSRGLETAPTRGAKVLYGMRTKLLSDKSSTTSFPANSGISAERTATHMLVQAEDPFSGVRVARSYFLASGKICKRLVDTDALVQQSHDSPASQQVSDADAVVTARDTRLMIALYSSLLRGLKAAAKVVCDNWDDNKTLISVADTAKPAVIDAMLVHLKSIDDSDIQMALLESKKTLSNELCVSLEIVDACGRSLAPTSTPTNDWRLVYCSLELCNVVSSDPAAINSLGSLVVGDSILFHRVKDQDALFVTKNFPYFRSWIGQGKEFAAKQALEATLQSEFMLQAPGVQLGKSVYPLDMEITTTQGTQSTGAVGTTSTPTPSAYELNGAILLLDAEEMPIVSGTMRVFTGGFLFKSMHFNPLLVSFARHVESFCVIPTQHEDLLLLTLGLKADVHTRSTPVEEVVPFPTETSCIRIPLLSGTRFQTEILHALKIWRLTAEGLDIPFYRPHDLPSRQQFDGDTPRDTEMKEYKVSKVLKDACSYLVSKQRQVSSNAEEMALFFPPDFIPKDPGANSSLPKPSLRGLQQHGIPVTVMIGVPGSKVNEISCSVCDISSSSFEWVHTHIDLRENKSKANLNQLGSFEDRLYDEVMSGIHHLSSQIVATADSIQLAPRIMVAVTGYADPITVACAIRHASGTTQIPVKISSIIACISATCVYLPDPSDAEMPFPKVFDQLTAGFTTHILLTNTDEVPPARVNRLRYRIEHCNPFAEVQVLSRQVFEGSITSILAVDRFENSYYYKYRQYHFPDWDTIGGKKLKYVVELDSHEVPQTFRLRLVPGMERSKFLDVAVRVLTPFASLGKSLETVHPFNSADASIAKGIRLAQSLAVGKIYLGGTGSDGSGNALFNDRAHPSAWNVEGYVSFDDNPSTVFEYISSGSYARLRKVDQAQQECQLELRITGRGINAEKLQHLLLNCYPRVNPVKQQMRTKQSITIAEKRALQKEHAMDPLPDGYMFDGTNYVDFYGGRYEFHPNMPQIIDEHIAAANEAAGEANVRAERAQKSEQEYVQLIA